MAVGVMPMATGFAEAAKVNGVAVDHIAADCERYSDTLLIHTRR